MNESSGMKTVGMPERPAQICRSDINVVGSGAAGLSAAPEAVGLDRKVIPVDAAPQLGGHGIAQLASLTPSRHAPPTDRVGEPPEAAPLLELSLIHI